MIIGKMFQKKVRLLVQSDGKKKSTVYNSWSTIAFSERPPENFSFLFHFFEIGEKAVTRLPQHSPGISPGCPRWRPKASPYEPPTGLATWEFTTMYWTTINNKKLISLCCFFYYTRELIMNHTSVRYSR